VNSICGSKNGYTRFKLTVNAGFSNGNSILFNSFVRRLLFCCPFAEFVTAAISSVRKDAKIISLPGLVDISGETNYYFPFHFVGNYEVISVFNKVKLFVFRLLEADDIHIGSVDDVDCSLMEIEPGFLCFEDFHNFLSISWLNVVYEFM
jgi:hypothetical protein